MTSQTATTTSNNNVGNRPVPSSDVAMFLRKTYTMIDTCDDSSLLEWCDNGTAFVIKDPTRLERSLIPQFYKHSKFSSFVRQLNFYSFRKVPYVDSVRIDPQVEAQTRNYWKFHHPLFQQGRPELLLQMKRMASTPTHNTSSPTSTRSSAKPDAVVSSSYTPTTPTTDPSTQAMQREMQAMKERMEAMNRTMDALATMVQQVTLAEHEQLNEHHKRPRIEHESTFPDGVPSVPSPGAAVREASTMSNATDNDFVEQLYEAFVNSSSNDELLRDDNAPLPSLDDDDEFDLEPALLDAAMFDDHEQDHAGSSVVSMEDLPQSTTNTSNTHNNCFNRPDPTLMDRLSDALTVLPKEMQTQLVERLINNITASLVVPAKHLPEKVFEAFSRDSDDDDCRHKSTAEIPLAAATLASLLAFYTSQLKQQQTSSPPATMMKSIPMIPAH